ncbi:MAG: eukaryotic-like serine/threonine-protein kinase [Acidobacteriota bacterium]
MALNPGARLGPYQIVATVGAGGMGEVYRARDTRIERTVAIKVVAGSAARAFTDDSLEREARAVGALNHPHICALHDVGRENGIPFLVMEYVKGETLAARIARGPLPLWEVIRHAIQIAEALDHAHRHGVVHRDLKPANIMLTAAGVKVLDFGLATFGSVSAGALPIAHSPSRDTSLDSDTTLLGTVHYLAPERLEGSDAEPSGDLFSLGVVIYEMATGRRPFEGSTAADVISELLRSTPPAASSVRPEVPRSLDWVVQKCLAKTPATRWQAAGDVVEVLRWLARAPEDGAPMTARPRRAVVLPAVAAALGIAALMFAAGRLSRPGAVQGAPFAFEVFPPERGGFTPTPASVPSPQFALSPDGRRLVFVAYSGTDAPQLWVRPLGAVDAHPVPGTQGAEYPFWSPDSASVGFFANASLMRVDLAGGPARVLAAAPHGRGGTWSRAGVILFAPQTQDAVYRIPAAGGTPSPVTHLDTAGHHVSHRWPQFLADDRHFIYFVQSTRFDGHGIYLGDLDTSDTHKLAATAASAAFVAPDHLLFVADESLMAARLDAGRGRLVGEATPVVAPVASSSNFYAAFSADRNGLLAYASGAATAELVWFDRDGRRASSIGAPTACADFRLSPQGGDLAVAEVDTRTHRPDLHVLDLARGAKSRLTYDAATDASPVWSPDGQRLVFRSNQGGVHDIYEKAANGSGPNTLLFQSPNAKYPTDWTPDGQAIVYHTYAEDTGSDIWLLSADGKSSKPLVKTRFDEMQGQVSRDGRWLAYASLESGRPEVYIRSLADAAIRWQVSAGGGTDPRWRGDSRELFYISSDSSLTEVAFAGGPAAPRPLFHVHVAPPGDPYLSNYDVTADGQRFLVRVPVHDVTSAPIRVLTNWMTRAAAE